MCSPPPPPPCRGRLCPRPPPQGARPGSLGRSSQVGSGTQTSPSAGPALAQSCCAADTGRRGSRRGPRAPQTLGPELRAGQHRRAPATPGESNRGLLRPLEAKGWRGHAGRAAPKSTSEPAPGPAGRKPSTRVQRLAGPGATVWGTCWAEHGQRGPVRGRTQFPRILGGGRGSHTLGCREGARSTRTERTSDWGVGRQQPACLARRASSGSQSDRRVPLQAPSSSTQHSWAAEATVDSLALVPWAPQGARAP